MVALGFCGSRLNSHIAVDAGDAGDAGDAVDPTFFLESLSFSFSLASAFLSAGM